MTREDEVIVWYEITANYAADYAFDQSNYGDGALGNLKAENQPVTWNETWYFDVVDGKFGKKWDFLKDHFSVLKQLAGEGSP